MNFSWGIASPVFFDSRRLHEPRIFSSRQKEEFFNRIGRMLPRRLSRERLAQRDEPAGDLRGEARAECLGYMFGGGERGACGVAVCSCDFDEHPIAEQCDEPRLVAAQTQNFLSSSQLFASLVEPALPRQEHSKAAE